MMSLKEGVTLKGLQPEILVGVMIVKDVLDKYKLDFVITAGLDGQHKEGSKHYIGQAVDIRSRNIESKLIPTIVRECKLALGRDFDLVQEDTHLHLEFDPKGIK
jgi:hypothetical protein